MHEKAKKGAAAAKVSKSDAYANAVKAHRDVIEHNKKNMQFALWMVWQPKTHHELNLVHGIVRLFANNKFSK